MHDNQPGPNFILWDSLSNPKDYIGLIYRWSGYDESADVYSLLRYVEAHGERLRRKYMAWIHELGESRIKGKRIIDHLALKDGLSYWWVTQFVEKSPWKSPSIVNAIRVLALEEIVVQNRPGKLCLVSANRSLHGALSGLCQSLGIKYEWDRHTEVKHRATTIKDIYRTLPHSVRALVSLAHRLWEQWPLRRTDKSGWGHGQRSIFFCSYFDNIVPGLAKEGVFSSRYWEGLPQLMKKNGLHGNWLQLYVRDDSIPNSKTAVKWIRGFNQNSEKGEFHTFLDGYLSWKIIFRVLRKWLLFNYAAWQLRAIKHAFQPVGTHISLWSFMRKDWHSSLCGPEAINNLLWIDLFDVAIHALPYQSRGFYLCENQGWERALIHAWRKYGHGQLVAVVHSTVRFWDLRYFADSRTVQSLEAYPMPQPTRTVLNGKLAMETISKMNYPKETLLECEALRYGYLSRIQGFRTYQEENSERLRVLILGDYSPVATAKLLWLLQEAAQMMSPLPTFTIKPHPNCFIKSDHYPELSLHVVTEPLGQIMQNFDIACAGNLTSAVMDAYLTGLPVIVVLDGTELNFSPLRGQPHVSFVSSSKELVEILKKKNKRFFERPDVNDFFFLNPELPKWFRLLTN